MFSYLRPRHGRTPSNPTSNPTSPAEQSVSEAPLQSDQSRLHSLRYQDALLPDLPTSPSVSLSSPITQVTSEPNADDLRWKSLGQHPVVPQPREPTVRGTKDTFVSSNHPRSSHTDMHRPGSAGNTVPTTPTRFQVEEHQTATNQHEFLRDKSTDPGLMVGKTRDGQKRSEKIGKRPISFRLPASLPASASGSQYAESTQQFRSGKMMLNLLNPLSLLARRRMSQLIAPASQESLKSHSIKHTFSENFDPRIRGTVVHDFSTPRHTSWNISPKETTNLGGAAGPRQVPRNPYADGIKPDDIPASPWSGGNRTPLFTENFEDESYPLAGPYIRQNSDLTDFMRPKLPCANDITKAIDSQSTSSSIKVRDENNSQASTTADTPPVSPQSLDSLNTRVLSSEKGSLSADLSTSISKSTTAVKIPSRNLSRISVQDAAIPRHRKSTSSRFSFDMIGAAEQERLLEDRHRKRALQKSVDKKGDYWLEDEPDNNFQYDMDDDGDGLEERIPGVNADTEEDDLHEEEMSKLDPDSGQQYTFLDVESEQNTGSFKDGRLPSDNSLSPVSSEILRTPMDGIENALVFAMTEASLYQPAGTEAGTSPVCSEQKAFFMLPEIPRVDLNIQSHVPPLIERISINSTELEQQLDSKHSDGLEGDFSSRAALEDDDLYFDDGIISGIGDSDDTAEFDESVFDNIDNDRYGRPVKSWPSLPKLYCPPQPREDFTCSLDKTVPDSSNSSRTHNGETSPVVTTFNGSLAPQPSTSEFTKPNLILQTSELTQDSLEAYQSALAAAAFAAAANGKFCRDSTIFTVAQPEENMTSGPSNDSIQGPVCEPFSPSYDLEDDFDYDDALGDDAIIAAANAEALANDCDGFYGQEFGFYSAPTAIESDAQYANGGYFGCRGVEAINRSQSGRAASREPNLTPITERSEYSNRESYAPGSAREVLSSGLAQLAGMMKREGHEGDMSFDALLRLRRGAWGSSEVSLHSSASSPKSACGVWEGGPAGSFNPRSHGSGLGISGATGNRWQNSLFNSVSESPSENESMTTISIDKLKSKEKEEDEGNVAPTSRHKHATSSDSISYLKEDDPVTGERWILERKRTGESGEVELLGREIIISGRI